MNKKFLMAMLAMVLVLAMAFTGCDEVLNEPKKGTETEVTGYGIISLDQSAVTCIVVFDPQGGDMGVVPKGNVGEVKTYVPSGEKATKPSPDPTKAGYTFGGWYTDTACKSLYDFNAAVTTDFTVYAKWVPISCKLIYSLNGAPGTPPYPPENLTCGQTIKAPIAPMWTGHTFVGWYLNADGTGTAWNFETDTVTANITLYAKWTLKVAKNSFAEAIADMENNATVEAMDYTLPGGVDEDYTDTITLTAGATSPAKVTIYGNGRGVTVPTGGSSSITVGSGVTLTLKNITFKTIPFSVAAGGTLVLDIGAIVCENTETAGITVYGDSDEAKGTLEMKAGALVMANSSSGVLVQANGEFTMSGGEISGNIWPDGGRYYYGGGVRINAGIFNMSGGEISSNYADLGGGVSIWDAGNFNMSGGVIKNNRVEFGGAGVHVRTNCIFNMTGGEITGNSCDRLEYDIFGGGVYLDGGTLAGNPQIGSTTSPGAGIGWIHGNIPNDVL
jgi:uncharacterized repeat protein (TIGR02543 family)